MCNSYSILPPSVGRAICKNKNEKRKMMYDHDLMDPQDGAFGR